MLPRWEEMGVGEGDRDRRVPYPFRDCRSRESEVDEKRYVTVAQVVHADPGKVSLLCGQPHLLSHLVVREGEDPLMRLNALEAHHRAQLLFEEWRHLDDAPGHARFGRTRLVAAPDLRYALPHRDDASIEIGIVAGEREQFSQAQPAPVEDIERAVRDRVVFDLLCKGKVLSLLSSRSSFP